jgi:hypothetical protein
MVLAGAGGVVVEAGVQVWTVDRIQRSRRSRPEHLRVGKPAEEKLVSAARGGDGAAAVDVEDGLVSGRRAREREEDPAISEPGVAGVGAGDALQAGEQDRAVAVGDEAEVVLGAGGRRC